MKKLVLPAAVLAACLLALVVTPSTEAAVADPISPTNWNTSPSGGCSVFRVIIGDCALPPDAFKPDSGGQILDPVDAATLDSIETASEVLPALSTISALGTISLGVGAFTVGWHIGNSLNNKWLHLDGAGLGTSSGDPGTGAIVTSPEWFLRSTTGAYATPAWAAMEKYSCNGQNYGLILTAWFNIAPGTPEACYSAAKKNFEASNGSKGKWVYVSTQYGSVGQKLYDSYAWVIDASAMPKLGLVQDEPMQPYTGQTTTLSTGWANPATGAGVTSTAPSYGSSNAPAPCFYDLSTNAPVCTGAAPTSSYSIEGLLTNGDPNFSDPGTNLVRGMMSPGSFAPAAPAGDGNWATTGGPLITIPDCHGLTVADCEAAVDFRSLVFRELRSTPASQCRSQQPTIPTYQTARSSQRIPTPARPRTRRSSSSSSTNPTPRRSATHTPITRTTQTTPLVLVRECSSKAG